jgi:hypothetical protein
VVGTRSSSDPTIIYAAIDAVKPQKQQSMLGMTRENSLNICFYTIWADPGLSIFRCLVSH